MRIVEGGVGQMPGDCEQAEFERLIQACESLTRAELIEIVTSCLPTEDVPSFVVLGAELSLDALRFVSARTLLRHGFATPLCR